jgi:high-affinity iron transporter
MTWADALPNLLIGLREGLEAGLVVSILLAALRKAEAARAAGADGPPQQRRLSSAPVWLGVTGAVAVSGSFAAVLTFSTSVLSSQAQEAVGGILSVLAVGLVTAMVFWMRRTAASLSGELRSKVNAATTIGAGALAVTAFLAVGREGLETTLFLWTAVKASGQTAAPLIGAAIGLAAAVLLCALLYRRAVTMNLGVFFSRTALALIVIAAGVLAYGLGDLQDAGLLPGHAWTAFDVSGTVSTGSWWAALITGVTELSPTMTVLQVVAWAVYLAVVVPAFLRAGRPETPAAQPDPVPSEPAPAEAAQPEAAAPSRWSAWLSQRRPWTVGLVIVVVPAVAASAAILALPAAGAQASTGVTVTGSSCAKDWTSGHTGAQTFEVTNSSDLAGEVNLDNAAGDVVAEIETLGPATTAVMSATLGEGTYTFRCFMSGRAVTASAAVQVDGAAVQNAPAAVAPITVAELQPAATAYQQYVDPQIVTLTAQVAAIRADLTRGDLAAARTDWLPAQLTWDRIGAAYDSFGDLGTAIDGLPNGLPDGVSDPGFTGLHRLEYGLWHGQSPAQLVPVVDTLTTNLATLRVQLPQLTIDPTDMPVRAHEILEDALRDRLSGNADEGSGAAYPETYADLQGTRVVLAELAPMIDKRAPKLLATIGPELDALQQALLGTQAPGGQWQSPADTPQAAREQVDAAIGAALESLSQVPDLLEVPPSR